MHSIISCCVTLRSEDVAAFEVGQREGDDGDPPAVAVEREARGHLRQSYLLSWSLSSLIFECL
jgi:hypothetical protein